MKSAKELSTEVNGILGRYIEIHDDIFKFSLRKLIPIPGIFSAIDYLSHQLALEVLLNELGKIQSKLMELAKEPQQKDLETEFVDVLNRYLVSLHETIMKLFEICAASHKKSEGCAGYGSQEYQRDMALYNKAVKEYIELGDELNVLFKSE